MRARDVGEPGTDQAAQDPDRDESDAVGATELGRMMLLTADTAILMTRSRIRKPRQALQGMLHREGEAIPLSAHLLRLPGEPTAGPGTLAVLRFSKPLAQDAPWTSVVLGSTRIGLGAEPEGPGIVFADVRTFVRDILAARAASTRRLILEFLTGTSFVDRQAGDVELSQNLHVVREGLRERYRTSTIVRDVPQAIYIEEILRVDETGFYVRGWARDTSAATTSLSAISPEGARTEISDRLYRYPRPDLDDFYGPPPGHDLGLLAFIELPVPSMLTEGWVFEVENALGSTVEFLGPSVKDDTRVGRDVFLSDMHYERAGSHELMEHHVHPAVSRIDARHKRGVQIDRVVQYGTPPPAPDVSIIVPLYRRIDFLEQQLAQFVHDPSFRAVDLIYVLDSPEAAEELIEIAGWLEPLYRLPFRVVTLDRNSGFAHANNLGASVAKGRLLILMNSDILPARPGWIRTMQEFYDATPDVGALGPKLLYEDGSIQHAGLYFYLDETTSEWNNDHYFKGMHGSLPLANVIRKVPAITAACMMIDASLYQRMGGLQGFYVQGDFEDSDLCLRLFQESYRSWYLPQAELYHLEGQSYPSSVRRMTGRYNRWRHSQIWADLIPTVMAEIDPEAPSARTPAESQPALQTAGALFAGSGMPDRPHVKGRAVPATARAARS